MSIPWAKPLGSSADRPSSALLSATSRRNFLGASAAAALSQRLQGAASRPNILFAISDDQSFAHTGASGDPVVRTPVFDRIAAEGVRFAHAFCSSPSCTPSRGAILTGQDCYRLEEGVNLWSSLPGQVRNVPGLARSGRVSRRIHPQGLGTGKGGGRRSLP